MAEWPETLPLKPLVNGYEESPPDVLLRTEMDTGEAKVRRRNTAGVRPFSAQFHMKSAQVTILDNFFTATLGHGALRFDFTHPRTGATVSIRFRSPPKYVPRGGGIWTVACSFEAIGG